MFGIGCTPNQKRTASAIAGAFAAYSGADAIFVGFGAPRELHWALAGVAVDVTCRGANEVVDPIMEVGLSALAGYGGAMLSQRIFPALL